MRRLVATDQYKSLSYAPIVSAPFPMTPRSLIVTGSSGLIGSEVAAHFDARGWHVHGVDNNQRAVFFGPAGDTRWNQARLAAALRSFTQHELDIRDRDGVVRLVAETFDQIVTATCHPSCKRPGQSGFCRRPSARQVGRA